MNFYEYCRERIEDFDIRFRLALRRMDRMRGPLSYADPELYYACADKLEDWCDDYNMGDPDDYDIEELLFED